LSENFVVHYNSIRVEELVFVVANKEYPTYTQKNYILYESKKIVRK